MVAPGVHRRRRFSIEANRLCLCANALFVISIVSLFRTFGVNEFTAKLAPPLPQTFQAVNLSLHQNPLRIYMYSLPPDFNWGILWQPERPTIKVQGPGVFETDVCPNRSHPYFQFGGEPGNFHAQLPVYAGNPSVQQFMAEYFLSLSVFTGLPTIRRVSDPRDAQIFFAPFFASMSYNHNMKNGAIDRNRQAAFMEWLSSQEHWKRREGRDHVLVAHHPTSLGTQLHKLNNSILIVADFSRPPSSGSYVEKDVVAPYIPFVKPLWKDWDSHASWKRRTTLAFFQGGFRRKKGGFIRMKLKEVLGEEKDIVMEEGKPSRQSIPQAQERLRKSKFCLMPAGDTPSSCRLYDSLQSLCVPVIISQAIELPFEDVLDFSACALLVPTYRALTKGYLASLLRNVTLPQWARMHQKMIEVRMHFLYGHPAKPGGAEDMIWQAVYRKLIGFPPASHREKRLKMQELEKDPASKYIW